MSGGRRFSGVLDIWRKLWRGPRGRRAAAALIVALSLPMLLGAAGLSVDVGYWYQQAETLQSAVDAAALAAATADSKYGDTTASSVEPFAVAAANNASNNQFGLTSSTLTVTENSPTTEADGQTVTAFIVNGTIPRPSFFSASFLPSIAPRIISASAQADVVSTPQPYCLITMNTSAAESIFANGSAAIKSSTCSFTANSTACAGGDSDAIAADPSGQIVAPSISTVGCTYANTGGGAYVGVTGGSASNGATSGYHVSNGAAAAPDPLASMGTPPPWPAMPTPGTGYTNIASDLGYGVSGTHSGATCGSYNAQCTVISGNYTGLSNVNLVTLQLNYPAGGTTNIIGGFGGNENTSLTLNASNYDISGATNGSGVVTNWAMKIDTPIFNVASGTDEFDGGMLLNGYFPVTTFGTGTYMFSAYSGGAAALEDTNANITFNGGTYWFNGGLTITGSSAVTFGPGIYYVENGNLSFGSDTHITVNGATFVLENGAGFQFLGATVGSSLTAPSTNCVQPASYPNPLYTDGTGGEGICGVLIYQARNDATASTVNGASTTTMNGIVYAPDSALSVTGGATVESANLSQTFAMIINTLTVTGATKVEPSLAPGSSLGSGSSTSTMLVN